jgi:GTP-binding protein
VRVTAARFVGAAARPGQEPPLGVPEVAFAGRSNVGKSSLLNALVGRRALARTSSTPGRTRQLNFFLLNEAVGFVDLPGYGFAVGSEDERASWAPLVEHYLCHRPDLRGVILIIDVRRGLQAEEIELLAFLATHHRPALLVATKTDKLRRGEATRAIRKLESTAGRAVPVVAFSARTQDGRDAIWKHIDGWLRRQA